MTAFGPVMREAGKNPGRKDLETMKTIYKHGVDLKPGDVVKVWWGKRNETLLETRPHPKYEEMFGEPGAMIGNFGGTEMTIEPHMVYETYVAE